MITGLIDDVVIVIFVGAAVCARLDAGELCFEAIFFDGVREASIGPSDVELLCSAFLRKAVAVVRAAADDDAVALQRLFLGYAQGLVVGANDRLRAVPGHGHRHGGSYLPGPAAHSLVAAVALPHALAIAEDRRLLVLLVVTIALRDVVLSPGPRKTSAYRRGTTFSCSLSTYRVSSLTFANCESWGPACQALSAPSWKALRTVGDTKSKNKKIMIIVWQKERKKISEVSL